MTTSLPSMFVRELAYDPRILNRYRKALDTAVMIATVNNVQPISGTTVVYCNIGSTTNTPCMSAKGLGNPRTVSKNNFTHYRVINRGTISGQLEHLAVNQEIWGLN